LLGTFTPELGWCPDHQHFTLVSLHKRINLSPFTKDFRGEEHYNESIDLFFKPYTVGYIKQQKQLTLDLTTPALSLLKIKVCIGMDVRRGGGGKGGSCPLLFPLPPFDSPVIVEKERNKEKKREKKEKKSQLAPSL